MSTISSISRVIMLVAWAAAGLTGCTSDADVPAPDTDGCPIRHYRIRSVAIPITAYDAIGVAFDLDGNGRRDNWLGFANALLHAWSPAFEIAPVIDASLEHELDWRLAIRQCNPGGAATAALAPGPAEPAGEIADEVFAAGADRFPGGVPLIGGTFGIPLGALSDALGGAEPGWVAAPLAQLRVDAVDDAVAHATVGLAVGIADVETVVAPNLAAYFTDRLAAGDSDFAIAADRDGDRIVTAAELLASETAQVLLAPDLTDQPALAGDGVSLGFRIAGTR
jgi:hypothetical protein